jgi:hypothetical protein
MGKVKQDMSKAEEYKKRIVAAIRRSLEPQNQAKIRFKEANIKRATSRTRKSKFDALESKKEG